MLPSCPLRPHIPEGEKSRLVAWADELRAVHARFRAALTVMRTALDAGCDQAAEADRDLLLFFQSGPGGSYDAGSKDTFSTCTCAPVVAAGRTAVLR